MLKSDGVTKIACLAARDTDPCRLTYCSKAPTSKEKTLHSKRSTLLAGTLFATSLLLGATGAVQAKAPDTMKAVPRFTVLPAKASQDVNQSGSLTTWQFSFQVQ